MHITHRRQVIGWIAALAAAPSRANAADAGDGLDAAADFIKRSGDELAELAPAANDSDANRERLRAFVEQRVDVDGIARFVLGRFWRLATSDMQRDYLALFHRVLIKNIVSRLGEYSPGKTSVEIGKTVRADAETTTVPTIVARPGDQPVHVNWIVEDAGGVMRIADVVVEGMSLRLTLRNDYASFILQHGGRIEPLLKAMRNQVGDPG